MDRGKVWIALLDEDEDDFLFWQYGFQTWASEVELKWFNSAEAFLSATTGVRPAALLLDGVVPLGEEATWLTRLLASDCCLNTAIFMLTGQFNENDRQAFLKIGAADYFIKPTNREELQQLVQKLVGYQSADSVGLD